MPELKTFVEGLPHPRGTQLGGVLRNDLGVPYSKRLG